MSAKIFQKILANSKNHSRCMKPIGFLAWNYQFCGGVVSQQENYLASNIDTIGLSPTKMAWLGQTQPHGTCYTQLGTHVPYYVGLYVGYGLVASLWF